MIEHIAQGAELGAGITVGKKVLTGEIFEDDIETTVEDVIDAAVGGAILGSTIGLLDDIFN